MKRIIKIFLLIIFITFTFGITTSRAEDLSVKKDTTAAEMLKVLENGGTLTGITNDIRNNNKYLLCNNKNVSQVSSAKYSIVAETSYPNSSKNDGFAEAYILAVSDENLKMIKQNAWWYKTEGKGTSNDLVVLAEAYEKYKTTQEKNVTLTIEKDATSICNDDKDVYGPVRIEYSYAKIVSNSMSDEWGGFNYAFFDELGNNISEKVQLCTLSNDNYINITSKLISDDNESNGYYAVCTADYNNVDLYIITKDKSINKVIIKLQENKVDYRASVYNLQGTYEQSSGYLLCDDCKKENIKKYEDKLYVLEHTDNYSVQSVYIRDYYNRYRYGTASSWINGEKVTYSAIPKTYSAYFDTQSNQWICGGCKKSFYYQVDAYDCAETHKYLYTWYRSDFWYTKQHTCTNSWTIYDYNKEGNLVIYEHTCGTQWNGGTYFSQPLMLIDYDKEENSNFTEVKCDVDVPIELAVSIKVNKTWDDEGNIEKIRPDSIKLKVYRSADQENWTELTNGKDYTIEWIDKEGDNWQAYISGLTRMDDNGNEYYFKVEEITFSDYYKVTYQSGTYIDGKINTENEKEITITNTKVIDIGGYVWLDGQTGIKPPITANGKMDDGETRLENIVVYLYYKNPTTNNITKISETVTDANGHYIFEKVNMGEYYVEFEYDGINYKNTISGGNSKAFENEINRKTFNARFQTISYGKSNDGTALKYNYSDKKSTLITNKEGSTRIADAFIMNASTAEEKIAKTVNDLNLGLVKRGVDVALSTDVYDAEVTINGQETTYEYNRESDTVIITGEQSNEKPDYNLNLYESDYYYRIRDYVNTQDFQEKDYMDNGEAYLTTGDELKVRVIYELNLQNQTSETVAINEVKYIYDEKYKFAGFKYESWNYDIDEDEHILTIDLSDRKLADGETKTIYIAFDIEKIDNNVSLGEFFNKAEITKYSTDEGLIDVDSQPGNFINDNQSEDDNDTARGIKISVLNNITYTRKISGIVFDEEGNKVNDVIVQLIEIKTANGNIYEYIWQEINSGANSGLRLNENGTALETYTISNSDGYYEFKGFIPGDYIVRFIYGDGTTYDMTENVIKYNGQDYKSMTDANYNAEWYNSSSYTEGASVARDNEARRLETMAYSVDINSVKGILLKLLNNVTSTTLNLTEKEILVATYNAYYDPDLQYTNIEDVDDEAINNVINKLLKEVVLKNTWMCAETSKIKVAVDTENITNTNTEVAVNGTSMTYLNNISNINLGLQLRPVTKIELKKYITGFKLIASNGQTLVNAYIDVDKYLDGTADSNKVLGVKDNVVLLDTVWQYEVAPTEVNTVVDGANLEFEYTLVVKNTGDTDYLSTTLADAYNTKSITEYKTLLTEKAEEMKNTIKKGTYTAQIGNTLGTSYYAGGTGDKKVLTEIIKIRDYVNNDLAFVTSDGDVDIDEAASNSVHRILRDDYSMQKATIKTILKTTKTTGKMENDGVAVLYTVTLGKNPISSTGNLSFENYIAEVMNYTNAAGRRAMTSTPGNAEIIDHEHRTGKAHEIDEADTGRIQVGAATGEDQKTNYVLTISIIAGVIIIAAGVVAVKKYVIKK